MRDQDGTERTTRSSAALSKKLLLQGEMMAAQTDIRDNAFLLLKCLESGRRSVPLLCSSSGSFIFHCFTAWPEKSANDALGQKCSRAGVYAQTRPTARATATLMPAESMGPLRQRRESRERTCKQSSLSLGGAARGGSGLFVFLCLSHVAFCFKKRWWKRLS